MAAKKKPAKKAAKKKSAKKKKAAKKKAVPKSAAKRAAAEAKEDPKVHQIQAIVDVMAKAGVVELETDDGRGGRLRLRFKEDQPQLVSAPIAMPAAHAAPAHAPLAAPAPTESAEAAAPAEPVENGEAIHSPMVGTFYRAPSPEAEPFVGVGDAVDENTTLCLIEAMKVMNEIKAEMNGKIIEILVENGEPVEFGQPLFRIAGN